MRILLTYDGTNEMKELSKRDDQLPKIHTNNMKKVPKRKSTYRLTDDSEDLEIRPKIVKINQKRINLPKSVVELYNNSEDKDNLNTSYVTKTFKINSQASSIPLRQILKPEAVENLKNGVIQATKRKKETYKFEKNVILTEELDEQFHLKKLNVLLEARISKQNIELMTYLSQLKTVSYSMIKKIASIPNERLSHWNRICNVQLNAPQENIIDKIKEKVNLQREQKLENYHYSIKNQLKGLKYDLKVSEMFIENNRVEHKIHKTLIDRHEDIKSYWKEMHIDNLTRK